MVIGAESPAAGSGVPETDGSPEFYKLEFTRYLEQGDLIPRSAVIIDETLRKYHSYHVEKPANEMFAVLTQSCDLVKHGGSCKARYIALAPVRPLRWILDHEFRDYLLRTPGGLFVLGSSETQTRYEDLLTKLINNNDSRYFFIPQRPDLQIAEDMCIMLPLSLAIRAEHYEACLAGRVAQLTDLFQAKLGWLLGQQFSRVGTPDWTSDAIQKKVRAVSDRALSWLPDHEYSQLKTALAKLEADKPDVVVDEAVLGEIRRTFQSKRTLVINAVLDVLEKKALIQPGKSLLRRDIRNELTKDTTFAKFLPG